MPVPFEILANHELPSELNLSTPLFKWDAHAKIAKPMDDLQIEFYDNLDAEPDDFSALTETPRPCKLLNPNLHAWQIGLLVQQFYVVDVNYDNTEHLAIVWGFYRPPRDTVIKPQIHDLWNELAEEEEE